MVENVLGFALEKGHSAVDWSTRPLPEPWLRYAALDVELLVDLRDALEEELREQGKLDWALQEFAAIAAAPPPAPRTDPWRRTSGMHKVRRRRQLGAVRELWTARDEIAQERDVSPGRVLTDAAIVAAALAMPLNAARPGGAAGLRQPDGPPPAGAAGSRRSTGRASCRSVELPQPGAAPDGPPPPRVVGGPGSGRGGAAVARRGRR